MAVREVQRRLADGVAGYRLLLQFGRSGNEYRYKSTIRCPEN